MSRPATHAGTWYSDDASKLNLQLNGFFNNATSTLTQINSTIHDNLDYNNYNHDYSLGIKGARILIGPHAGFTYSGSRLAETYQAWDISRPIKTIFILGPSHHVAFKNYVMISKYHQYQTPLGNLYLDIKINNQLINLDFIKFMLDDIDNDEHSFEIHAPFIKYRLNSYQFESPKIVPILILSMDSNLLNKLQSCLLPYLLDPANHFVISSDFCHWGSRFAYTKYYSNDNLISLSLSTKLKLDDLPIYKSIEKLDRKAMIIATNGDFDAWVDYINQTGNTICGQKPISLILKLLQELSKINSNNNSNGIANGTTNGTTNGKSNGNASTSINSTNYELLSDKPPVFNWIGYSQSNHAKKVYDSSVSYASGYAIA